MESVGRLLTSYVVVAAIGCAVFVYTRAEAQPPSPPQTSAARLCPPLANQQLKCPSLGFTYKVPFGWVDRTDEMQPGEVATPSAGKDSSAEASATKAATGTSETLLAVFERPPEA